MPAELWLADRDNGGFSRPLLSGDPEAEGIRKRPPVSQTWGEQNQLADVQPSESDWLEYLWGSKSASLIRNLMSFLQQWSPTIMS